MRRNHSTDSSMQSVDAKKGKEIPAVREEKAGLVENHP
jgi:hypothetical protein